MVDLCRWNGQQSHDAGRGNRFSGARLAHQAVDFSGFEGQVDAAKSPDNASFKLEAHIEVPDHEQLSVLAAAVR